MAKFLFLSLFLFCSFHANPQNYIITEQEIQIIGNYNQKLEMEKQDWLRQAKTLNQQVKELRKESMTLNQQVKELRKESMTLNQQVESLSSQLKNQREVNRKLEKSYNKSEEENYNKINNLSVELDKIEKKYHESKNRFMVLLSILIIESATVVVYIIIKFKF